MQGGLRELSHLSSTQKHNCYLQDLLQCVWTHVIHVEERLKEILAKKHSQFPRELIKYILYFDIDSFLFSMLKVGFLHGFPVQNIQVKSMSLAMAVMKRNNMQLEINPYYLTQGIHFSAWKCPVLFKIIRMIIVSKMELKLGSKHKNKIKGTLVMGGYLSKTGYMSQIRDTNCEI